MGSLVRLAPSVKPRANVGYCLQIEKPHVVGDRINGFIGRL
jgi:hypothetical protein